MSGAKDATKVAPLRVGLLLAPDNFEDGPEKEALEMIRDLWTDMGVRAQRAFLYERAEQLAGAPDCDLLVFDYGVLWQGGFESYHHVVRRWAEDHPGKVAIAWTGFTSHLVRRMSEDLQYARGVVDAPDLTGKEPRLGNIWIRYPAPYGYGEADDDNLGTQLRRWYGLPQPPSFADRLGVHGNLVDPATARKGGKKVTS